MVSEGESRSSQLSRALQRRRQEGAIIDMAARCTMIAGCLPRGRWQGWRVKSWTVDRLIARAYVAVLKMVYIGTVRSR